MTEQLTQFIAVDVGNNRIKLGLFNTGAICSSELPKPLATDAVVYPPYVFDGLERWLPDGRLGWFIGSVNRPAHTELVDWILKRRPNDRIALLAAGDLPLEVRVERPDMVGVDRLLDALAANHIRPQDRPAVVVDLGSAITVDLISKDGAFLGGAILPGIGMAARALHEFTDLLPLIDLQHEQLPESLGKNTVAAMKAGLFWGAVGAIERLVTEYEKLLGQQPAVFLTGGAAANVANQLRPKAIYVPHLTLGGVALAVLHLVENQAM